MGLTVEDIIGLFDEVSTICVVLVVVVVINVVVVSLSVYRFIFRRRCPCLRNLRRSQVKVKVCVALGVRSGIKSKC